MPPASIKISNDSPWELKMQNKNAKKMSAKLDYSEAANGQ